MITYKIPIFLM